MGISNAPHRSPRTSNARATPITREEQRRFRKGVYTALREQSNVFSGTIRAFAKRLRDAHAGAHPFESQSRMERWLSELERSGRGPIRFTWGQSQKYPVVQEIRLVDGTAIDPPKRRNATTHRRANRSARTARRMEILAHLVAAGGAFDSIVALRTALLVAGCAAHRATTIAADISALDHDGHIKRMTHRVKRREVTRVEITDAGRTTLAAHDAPAMASRGTRAEKISEFSLAILAVLAVDGSLGPSELHARLIEKGITPSGKPKALNDAVQALRCRCRDLINAGYLERFAIGRGRTLYDITGVGRKLLVDRRMLPAAAPPAAPPRAPSPSARVTDPHVASVVTHDAPSADGPGPSSATLADALTITSTPEPVAAFDREIARIEQDAANLGAAHRALDEQAREIAAQSVELANKLARLRELRDQTATAFGVSPEKSKS